MSTHKVFTIANEGLLGCQVVVEVDESKGLPKIEIIGLPDAAIKESKERIRSSFKHSGLPLPPRRLIVNLAPSHVRKNGTRFDLPISVALLCQLLGIQQHPLKKAYFFGELGLDGSVKRVTGLLPSVIAAYKQGVKSFVIPEDNINELRAIDDIELYPIRHFRELVEVFQGGNLSPKNGSKEFLSQVVQSPTDVFGAIKGHTIPKRAICIAAAGMHNILLIGPPGSGKSLLAKSIPGLLPQLGFHDLLEVSQIYSLAGLLDATYPLVTSRPFRSVHHTASKVSIVGGGQQITPGEVSLAHKGVLFFDELPEFPNQVLEVLRQPLEDGQVTISRAHGTVVYPSDIMFVGAMNPCRCGFYKDREKQCICSLHDIQRYQQKISGPLLDRFDMIVEVPREKIATIMDQTSSDGSDNEMVEQITLAQELQNQRFLSTKFSVNSDISPKHFHEMIQLDEEGQKFIQLYAEQYALSGRVVHKLCKVARTIADMAGCPIVQQPHLAEAVYYRGKTLFVHG